MSEHREKDASSQPPAEENAAEAGHAAGTQVEASASDTGKNTVRRAGSGAIAWVALLLAAIAAGLATQPHWDQWFAGADKKTAEPVRPAMEQFRSLADRLADTAETAEQNAQTLEQLHQDLAELETGLNTALNERPAKDFYERADQLSARLERLEGQFNTRLGGVRGRVEDLEEQVGRRLEQFELRLADFGAGLDRADRDLATRLRLVEVDSLFALAQDQLAVSGDVAVARRAWQRGLERLAVLEDAEFTELKKIARQEFGRLEGFRPPDTAADVARLYTIVDAIGQWPAAYSQANDSSQADDSSRAVDSSQTQSRQDSETPSAGWRDRLGGVFDELVTIENVDRDHFSPAEVDLVRERLQSTLQAAAVALVRADQDTARRLIERVLERAERAFDSDAGPVEESLQWLSTLAARDDDDIRPPSLEDSRAEIARLLGSVR